MNRRDFITATSITVFTAGCIGGSGSGDSSNTSSNSGDSTKSGSGSGDSNSGKGSGSGNGNGNGNGGGDGKGDSKGGSSSVSPPSKDAKPKELLPKEEDGWKLTGTQPEPSGEAGIIGSYENSNGKGYSVGVYRWSSKSKAKKKKDTFKNLAGTVYVVLGNFSFVGYGYGKREGLYTLLSKSPVLTRKYVENNDMMN